jgi:hypothetical protein
MDFEYKADDTYCGFPAFIDMQSRTADVFIGSITDICKRSLLEKLYELGCPDAFAKNEILIVSWIRPRALSMLSFSRSDCPPSIY